MEKYMIEILIGMFTLIFTILYVTYKIIATRITKVEVLVKDWSDKMVLQGERIIKVEVLTENVSELIKKLDIHVIKGFDQLEKKISDFFSQYSKDLYTTRNPTTRTRKGD